MTAPENADDTGTDEARADEVDTDTGATPDPALKGAGLSATGTTADEFVPGQAGSGATYGDPGGTGAADLETTSGDPDSDAGEDAEGAPA